MSVFQPTTVVADDKTVIALKHIESMNLTLPDEDKIIDKLRGDVTIKVRTVSGVEYIIPMSFQKTVFSSAFKIPETLTELQHAIFERWVNLIS